MNVSRLSQDSIAGMSDMELQRIHDLMHKLWDSNKVLSSVVHNDLVSSHMLIHQELHVRGNTVSVEGGLDAEEFSLRVSSDSYVLPVKKKTGAFRRWGGSSGYASKIVQQFPEHKVYVELFAGAAACLFSKEPVEREVLVDKSVYIINAFEIIAKMTDKLAEHLQSKFNWVSSRAYYKALIKTDPKTTHGMFHKFVYLSFHGYSGIQSWHPSSEGKVITIARFLRFSPRLKNVEFINSNYVDVVKDLDNSDTFFFMDPPYPDEWDDNAIDAPDGSKFDLDELATVIRSIEGKWTVVVGDKDSHIKFTKDLSSEEGVIAFTLTTKESRSVGGSTTVDRFFATNASIPDSVTNAKGEQEELICKVYRISKVADDKQILLGVVLEPGETDAHEDTISAEEIENAANLWLARKQNRGLMHTKIVNSKIEIYQSWVTLADLTVGGQKVKKGTWLLMLHILDDEIWKKVKSGEFTGLSIGGHARRRKL